MVVLCRSLDSDSAGHKVSRRNRGLGRENVRGLGRPNCVRHSREGRHSRSGRYCSSGRHCGSGRHCRDPETRVSSEHKDLLWDTYAVTVLDAVVTLTMVVAFPTLDG